MAKKSLFDCKNQSILSNKKIEDIQKPTSEATEEQVSEELDEQIRGHLSCLIVESALRSSSKRKRKGSAKKENPVYSRNHPQNIVQTLDLESAMEVSGFT